MKREEKRCRERGKETQGLRWVGWCLAQERLLVIPDWPDGASVSILIILSGGQYCGQTRENCGAKLLWEIAGLNYYWKLRSPNFLFRTAGRKTGGDWSVKSGALKIPFSANWQKIIKDGEESTPKSATVLRVNLLK